MKKLLILLISLVMAGCNIPEGPRLSEPEIIGSMELQFAQQFKVDFLADGLTLITIADGGRFLIVPAGRKQFPDFGDSTVLLRQPVGDVYLAATSAMCFFDALSALDSVTMSGTKADDWYIENARKAMESGSIAYAGKYSAPDYELITAKNCGLAIESTMIDHVPDVKEKLGDLGIPVLTERSSYEPHPLGRSEWIKLYGLILGKYNLAESLFNEQTAYLDAVANGNADKTAAFFHISSSGNAVVRGNGDYITKMVELAGGRSVFNGDNGETGSVNIETEQFYSSAKDADFIIYNSSIDGGIHTVDELLGKSQLVADFKAVKNGNVWCTKQNFFQETMKFGLMISDMHRIFSDDTNNEDDLNFLYKLR